MSQDLFPSPTPSDPESPLDSWKAIAAHLSRDVSTVKRWEKYEGLPVHRHLHQSRSSVYAYPSELDAWRIRREPAEPRTPPRPLWRRPTRVLTAAMLLMVALASVGDSHLSGAAKESTRGGTRIERRLLSQHDMDLNNFFELKPAPDGRRVAYSAIGTVEGALYVRDLNSKKTRKLTAGEFTGSPVWSPDGKRIAYTARHVITEQGSTRLGTSTLKVLDLKTGTGSVVIDLGETAVSPLDWSPDGSDLLCKLRRPDRTSSLVLVPLSKGGVVTLVSQGNSTSSASFSPNGRYIAFSAIEDGNRDIYVLTADASEKYRITQEDGAETFPLWSPTGDAIVYRRDDGVWAVKVVNGRPQGQPKLVGTKRFDQPVSWTPSGLFYVMGNDVSAQYVLPVNPQTTEATGTVKPLDIGLDLADRLAWSPDMKWIAISRLGDKKIYAYSVAERSVRSFATGADRGPSGLWWSGDGTSILFVVPNEGHVFSLKLLDGVVHPLFPAIAKAERFQITSNGKNMLFFKFADERTAGNRQLVVSRLGEPDGQVIASERDPAGAFSNWVRPAFSPDGSQVLLGRSNTTEESLWVLDVDGSNPRKLIGAKRASAATPEGDRAGPLLHYAVWAPSGRHIAYDTGRSLFVVDVKTAQQHQLPLPPEFRTVGVMQWSPDGAVIGLRGQTSNYELWTTNNPIPAE